MKTKIERIKVDTSSRERKKLQAAGVPDKYAKKKFMYTLYEVIDGGEIAIFQTFNKKEIENYQKSLS